MAAQQGTFLAKLFNNMAKTEALESEIQSLSSSLNIAPEIDAAEVSRKIEDLEKRLKRVRNTKPFHYSHQGSLCYIGSERAVADVSWWNGNIATGGTWTYIFWRSVSFSEYALFWIIKNVSLTSHYFLRSMCRCVSVVSFSIPARVPK